MNHLYFRITEGAAVFDRIGYSCVSMLLGRTTNHPCRLSSASPEKLRGLIRKNLDELELILHHNVQHGWKLFRVGSSVIPLGPHPVKLVDESWTVTAIALTGANS